MERASDEQRRLKHGHLEVQEKGAAGLVSQAEIYLVGW